jgi:hypothetical protein
VVELQKQAMEEAKKEDDENRRLINRLRNEQAKLLNQTGGENAEVQYYKDEVRRLQIEVQQNEKAREKLESLKQENRELRYQLWLW